MTRCPFLPRASLLLGACGPTAWAQLAPEWIAQLPAGTSLTAGMTGFVVDSAGNSALVGTVGPSSNTDVLTASFSPSGVLRWQHQYNGNANWHDQGRGISFGLDGLVYSVGNTPGPGSYANVLTLGYEAATGVLAREIQFSSGPLTSEFGASVLADASGNVFVGGGTVGDGGDGLIVGFSPSDALTWRRQYDGPAFGPFSQDHVQQIARAPDGSIIARIHGVMNSLHPDYVIAKYAPDGTLAWISNFGVSGGDFSSDVEIDAAGDIYVSGIGINVQDRYLTVKFRGSDGAVLWHAYDGVNYRNYVYGLALDGQGGVYITGQDDPNPDQSFGAVDIYTVKRDAQTGAQLWTHRYGSPCKGCADRPGDIVVDSAGHAIVVGTTSSPPSSGDMILLVLDAMTGLEVDRGIVGGGPDEFAGGSFLRLDANENIYVGGHYSNFNTGAVGLAVFKFGSLVGGCAADLTGEGSLDTNDFFLFLSLYQAQDTRADFTGEGHLDTNDFFAFLAAYQAGC